MVQRTYNMQITNEIKSIGYDVTCKNCGTVHHFTVKPTIAGFQVRRCRDCKALIKWELRQ